MSEKMMGRFRSACELLSPSFLSGYTFPDWVRLLRLNGWDVEGRYIPRALMATFGALATSAIKPFELRFELDTDAEEVWRKPLFILGLARSGTTHLFNLLARTGAVGYPARLDCYNPHTFLLLRKLGFHRLLARVPSKKRVMDNVETGWLSPEEDRIAMQILGESCRTLLPFPRQSDCVAAWRSPYGNSPEAKEQFCNGLRNFSKKLVHLHRLPLLLKSPSHMMAIPEILSVFPEARFIMILRNPFDQFASLAALLRNPKRGFFTLQEPPRIENEEILEGIHAVLSRYLEARPAIAGARLYEMRYEQLVSEPSATLQEIQNRFDLGSSPINRNLVLPKYIRNTHGAISESLRTRLREIYEPYMGAGLIAAEEIKQGSV